MRRSADPSGKTGSASSRRTQLSTLRPMISAERIATHSRSDSSSICSTRSLYRPSALTGILASCSVLGASVPPYTCADDAKTILLAPVSAIAASTLRVPSMFTCPLARAPGPGLFAHARCATTSAPPRARVTTSVSRMSAATNSAALGQLSGR